MSRTIRRKNANPDNYWNGPKVFRDNNFWNVGNRILKEMSKSPMRANEREKLKKTLEYPERDYVFFDRNKDYDDIWNYD